MAGELLRGSSPAANAVAVTKSDVTVYNPPLRGLYVGVTGDLSVVMAGDTDAVLFTNVAVGYHPLAVKQVMDATTADEIIGLR